MVSFQQKELEHIRTIGGRFKKTRLSAGLTIDDISKKTNISSVYLIAIENGDFDDLPGDIYVKNFLRVYADFLELDYQIILKEYEFERDAHHVVKTVKTKTFNNDNYEEKSDHWYSFITASLVQNLLVGFLVLASLLFLISKINNIVSPPLLLVLEPENNMIIKDNYIEIKGKTEPGAKVVINGQDIMIDPNGDFHEGINLQSGLNIIKISSKKKYSKTADVYKEVLVEK